MAAIIGTILVLAVITIVWVTVKVVKKDKK